MANHDGLVQHGGLPDAGEQLKAFLAGHSVSAIIVDDHRYQLTKFDGGPTPDVPVRVPIGPIERGEIDRCSVRLELRRLRSVASGSTAFHRRRSCRIAN